MYLTSKSRESIRKLMLVAFLSYLGWGNKRVQFVDNYLSIDYYVTRVSLVG